MNLHYTYSGGLVGAPTNLPAPYTILYGDLMGPFVDLAGGQQLADCS